MASYKYVIYEKTGNIARITLNRPDKLNAMQFIGRGPDAAELWAAVDEASEDDDVKVVLLKGAGRAFCVGHDLTKVGFVYGMGTGKPGERRPSQRMRLKLDRMGYEDYQRLMMCPKLTITQVHGHCFEAGLYLVNYSDYAIAAEDAMLGYPGQRLGFAGTAFTPMLAYTVGFKVAMDLVLTGRTISGREAADIHLVSKAVPADKLEEEANKVAESFALLPRDGIAIGKAYRQMVFERMGLLSSIPERTFAHTLFTQLRWEPDEYNFFRERRERGTRSGFHSRDDRYAGLV